jgi:hypothetical protein
MLKLISVLNCPGVDLRHMWCFIPLMTTSVVISDDERRHLVGEPGLAASFQRNNANDKCSLNHLSVKYAPKATPLVIPAHTDAGWRAVCHCSTAAR